MYDLECPYCEAELEVSHDDGFGFEEDEKHEMQCKRCEKNFTFQTSIHYDYDAEKADCLNGGPHRFGVWFGAWVHDGKKAEDRYCKGCERSERRTTPEE
jgi:hypothetical protein